MRKRSGPSPRALRVWDRLRQWYGARLAEQYGDAPPDDWCESVDCASDEAVRLALRGVREKHVTYPPTLPEFEALLRRGAAASARAHSADLRAQLVEHINRTRRLSDRQRAQPWNWIVRWFDDPKPSDPARKGVEFLGVIVPQCPRDPEQYPAHRVMLAELETAQVAA